MYGKQVDDEVNRELKLWDEKLHEEGHRICKEHGFTTGFLEGGGAHSLVDSYELKVCLHTLTSKPYPLPNLHCSLQFYPVDNVASNFASPLLYFKFFVLGGVSMFGWITTVAPTIISIEMSLGLEGEVGACAREDEVDFQ
jgi:hypothetical protein